MVIVSLRLRDGGAPGVREVNVLIPGLESTVSTLGLMEYSIV